MILKQMLKEMTRDFLTGLVLVSLLMLVVFSYTNVWPSFVVVSSGSMQHGFAAQIGVIDTGDIVLVKAGLPITYIEGRDSGYSTYGDYGDVIVFLRPDLPYYADHIIHRAIIYVQPNGTGYDVPSLHLRNVTRVSIDGMGWQHNLNITFRLDLMRQISLQVMPLSAGYVTMGDNNAPSYDPWIVPASYVIGKARGEIPYLGLLKLMLQPGAGCCTGWNDQNVAPETWFALDLSLVAITVVIMASWFFVDLRRKNEG